MPSRRALVVGIDEYPGSALHGCVNDARRIAKSLAQHEDGSPNFDVQLITVPGETVTRGSLKAKIDALFGHDEADVALLYFSGHGTENDLGGFLVTPDATSWDEGINLADVLTMANLSAARERVIILDSCMSGALGTVPATGSDSANLKEGVAILTASRAGQVSMESGGRGVFTDLVCGALEGGASDVLGDVSVASVYTYVEQALGPWEQRPLFKGHLSRLVSLRKNRSVPSIETIRELVVWFATAKSRFPLDPTYEDTEPNSDPEHVAVFKQLQKCRDAKLVQAVDAEYMYFAAKNSTSCELTPLGRHYWGLVKAGRL